MIGESGAIILLILIMLYMFVRSGRQGYAVLTWPLLVVPGVHLLSNGIYRLIGSALSMQSTTFYIVVDVLGLVVAALLFGGLSKAIKVRRMRLTYLAVCMVFSITLTAVMVRSFLSV